MVASLSVWVPSRYEKQRDQLMGQSFNMQQTAFMTQTMEDTVTTVRTLRICIAFLMASASISGCSNEVCQKNYARPNEKDRFV